MKIYKEALLPTKLLEEPTFFIISSYSRCLTFLHYPKLEIEFIERRTGFI
jgi:hypothetical protein